MRYIVSYVSTISKSISDSDIEELMKYVKLQNNDKKITGILIYSEGNFFQVLEGQEEDIKTLFDKIKKDSRHYNIIKMLDKPVKGISFSEYHSSFTIVSGHNSHDELQNFLENEKTHNPEHFKSISYLIQKFIKPV
ncbi:BLUF domain-containing protein [Aquimarina algicola]|uniref:BLUF domain-containing protein n=1 Tax=Aquimarina algicola TaxID=2589995 RepID=A0A504J5U7_9FLAO|nr:BLUF domain-containing protein [Aquimarina algicola]TPN83013.1 BLUF domain-containing protein [Aquimarina algicola]